MQSSLCLEACNRLRRTHQACLLGIGIDDVVQAAADGALCVIGLRLGVAPVWRIRRCKAVECKLGVVGRGTCSQLSTAALSRLSMARRLKPGPLPVPSIMPAQPHRRHPPHHVIAGHAAVAVLQEGSGSGSGGDKCMQVSAKCQLPGRPMKQGPWSRMSLLQRCIDSQLAQLTWLLAWNIMLERSRLACICKHESHTRLASGWAAEVQHRRVAILRRLCWHWNC